MPTVLVVDDSATIRRIVRRTLSQAGYEVAVAVDGRDALEVAQQQVFDLILVDFVMPHMNGLRFVQAMRQVSNLEHVPVVLMSAKADRIGRYLLRESLIDREDLDRILKNRGPNRGLLGTQLVKLGYISLEELRGVLVQQTSELIYEALRWRRGEFRFVRFASRPEAEDADLGLPVASILMEGLRRVDEWRLIEEQLHSFDAIPRRDEEALRTVDLERFAPDERRVLAIIDGASTVGEIVERSQLSSFEVCKVIFQMATSRLVRLE